MHSYLLHQLLDAYERRPQALELEIERLVNFEDESTPLVDQAIALGMSSMASRKSIRQKTLIDTQSQIGIRHRQLLGELLEQLKVESSGPGSPDISEFIEHPGLLESVTMRSEHLTQDYEFEIATDDQREWVRRASGSRISTELVRMFADRLDSIADSIEKFDETSFDRLIPVGLEQLFRELHMNAVLGNYGTACILCGALLERALQDLLPSESLLNDLITQAKAENLLVGHHRRFADQIRDNRNSAVHGRKPFSSISSDDAWTLVDGTRMLISYLYRGRLE